MSTENSEELKEEIGNLKEEIGRYQTLLDGIPCTVSWIGSDLKYLMVNKKLADVIGLKRSEIIGKDIGFLTENSSTSGEFFLSFINKFQKSNKQLMQEELKISINDKNKYFWITAIRMESSQDFLLFGIDITEIVFLRERVTLLSKLSLLGEISAGIVHEINNPLQVIMGKARKIQRLLKSEENTGGIESAEAISTHSKRIAKIVKSIKLFVHDSKASDDEDSRHFLEIIEEVRDICSYVLSKGAIDLKVEAEDCFIPANATMVYQILVNLISNAAYAVADLDEKWIKITSEVNNGQYHFKIQDSGDGIDKDVVDKIFNPFYTSKPVGKGTGLGLYLSLKMAKDIGGNLSYDHSSDNTSFIFSYPCKAE